MRIFEIKGFRIFGEKLEYRFLEVVQFLVLKTQVIFKKKLGNELVRVCRNSQTLQQHMKNVHKERRKAGQKKKVFC